MLTALLPLLAFPFRPGVTGVTRANLGDFASKSKPG
jgi:hypothetical protein